MYVSAGGKWVKIRVPSMPSHQNVWCGIRLVWFQEIFWVRNQSSPASRAICGNDALYPNESGSQMPRVSTPSSSAKNRLPCTIWRARASPPGRLASDSTHIDPTGAQLPAATASLIRSNTCGCACLTHAYCWACEHANTSSGYSLASDRTLAKVRVHLRTVSRSGHSHAESMCA